jgi:hypothetical protein
LRGSVEVHTAQVQPTIGTPVDVPVPRKVKVAEGAGMNGIVRRSTDFTFPIVGWRIKELQAV